MNLPAMNANESSANEAPSSIFDNGEQAQQQPGTSSFDLMEFYPVQDEDSESTSLCEWNSAMFNGSYVSGNCHVDPPLPSFHEDSMAWNDGLIFSQLEGIQLEHGSSSSPPSIVSPVSTYSWPTLPSTPEDAEGNGLSVNNNNSSGNCIHLQRNQAENFVRPAELSRPGCSRTCTGCMRPASACHDAHRLTASEVAISKKFFKGVKQKKNSRKWPCEIRISKKLPKHSQLKSKRKLWIGTFDTSCQAARALHVGRFLLSEKPKSTTDASTFLEQSCETILSDFKARLRGTPLDDELLCKVRDFAIRYGKTGSM